MPEPDIVKMVLNRAALDRLIGGDREMELIMTHAAVRKVIEDHLEIVRNLLRDNLRRVIADQLGVQSGSQFVASSQLTLAMDRYMRSICCRIASQYCQEQRARIIEETENQMKKQLAALIEEQIKKVVQTQLKALVEAELKRVVSRLS